MMGTVVTHFKKQDQFLWFWLHRTLIRTRILCVKLFSSYYLSKAIFLGRRVHYAFPNYSNNSKTYKKNWASNPYKDYDTIISFFAKPYSDSACNFRGTDYKVMYDERIMIILSSLTLTARIKKSVPLTTLGVQIMKSGTMRCFIWRVVKLLK